MKGMAPASPTNTATVKRCVAGRFLSDARFMVCIDEIDQFARNRQRKHE
jgi:hypothetical protein